MAGEGGGEGGGKQEVKEGGRGLGNYDVYL
jgi:hypothetical protein